MDISRVRITIGPVLGALLSVLFLSVGQAGQASGPQGALKRFEFTKLLMGVQARIVVYAPSEKEATDAGMLAFDRIARLEDVMSDYRPQSELMRVCDDGKMGGVAVRISEDLRDVLAASEGAWRQSGGAFDPTVGPLVTLWRQARKDGKLPPTEAIAEAKARVGWKHVHLDAGARTVSFDVPGMRLDLGGIGKGFAVEAAGAVLRGRGVASYLVALAGDIAVGDAPPGERGWEIAVRTGAAELGGEPTLELERSAVSTSGDAEQFVEIEGVRYAHIIDPRTGLGVTRRVGATVIGPLASAAEVDALATAVCVLGADKGMELLRGLPGVGGMIMERERDGAPMTRRRTPGFGAAPGDDNRFDPANEPPAGFVAMFNGRDLSGWQGLAADPVQRQKLSAEDLAKAQSAADERMRAHWHAVDGVLVFDGKGDSLQSARNYGDFEMYVDWKIEKAGDSGIYVRGSPQVQIWDNPLGSGGLYNNQKNPANPLVVADRPVGEWNRSHIIMKGDRVTVWLNDRLVTDNTVLENYWEREKPIYPTGPIELQNHGNTLYFKNIFVRDLSVPGAAAGAGQADHDTRMAWWRDARFGMFIHWGLYAIPAGVWDGKPVGGIGEWIMNSAKVPVAEYEKLAQRFNPAKFDARVWAKTAKDAGIKYVVITSKHHDGFALFDSKVSDYDVMGTPFKRDILKELSEACRAEGIRFCTYHSIMDWHHPDYLPRRPWDPRPDVKPDFNRYVGYLKAQLKEIVTGYQPAILWFDGEWEDTWTHERGKDLYDYVRSLKPDIIINNRVDKGRSGMAGLTMKGEFKGDYGTPEQEVPATGLPGVDWESCMTMNDTWGFKADDSNWKSSETLIRTLVDIASKGGNFLLNVGPTSLGEIPAPSVERLRAMGAWIKANDASIYGTHAGPFAKLPWGRCTAGDGVLYLHVFNWPAGGVLHVPGLLNEVRKAWLLADPGKAALTVDRDEAGATVHVPAAATDPVDTVVALEIVGSPAVVVPPIPALRASADGSITLTAAAAQIRGQTARFETAPDHQNIGFWTEKSDSVWWPVEIAGPAKFRVSLEYACAPENGGRFLVAAPDAGVEGDVTPTGSWTAFKTIDVGELEFKKAGRAEVSVRPVSIPSGGLMNLRTIKLTPAR